VTDTGPPYPPTAPGDIGEFIIGVSAIGGGRAFDFWKTVISQYANSPILIQLLINLEECISPKQNFDAFFDNIWNIDTAQGYGLDVWGRIVGVVRTLHVATGDFFGFKGPGGVSGEPFNQAPFYNGDSLTSNFNLTDDAFRQLIFAKALANISDGSIKSINAILRSLFPGRGNCYVADGLDMTLTYTFEFVLSPVEQAIVGQSGVLPKSTGVFASVSSL
jgi:hypothetical protein